MDNKKIEASEDKIVLAFGKEMIFKAMLEKCFKENDLKPTEINFITSAILLLKPEQMENLTIYSGDYEFPSARYVKAKKEYIINLPGEHYDLNVSISQFYIQAGNVATNMWNNVEMES